MTQVLTDATHDSGLRSWVDSANAPGCDFPIQNLPFGRFRRQGSDEAWRIGVAIGEQVLDLQLAAAQCPWGDGIPMLLEPLAAGDLKGFMALGRTAWKQLRAALSQALADGSDQGPFLELCLLPRAEAEMSLPCAIGDYTDFYAGIHHARTIGKLFRPDNPLLPNYPWVPIGYHGRASSIGLGGPVKRPHGQIKAAGDAPPQFGPCQRLDYELEVGALSGGPMRKASRWRWATPRTRCSAWCCSTTGRHATSSPGSTSRWGLSSARASRPRSRPGS
jgi:fumarylacetoacetase